MRKLWIVLLILIFISTTTAIAGPPQSKGVNPNNLRSTNALTDNYVPSYDATTKKFTWVANGAGGTAADIDLTADGDFNDYDIHAVDGLYGIDDDVYIDMGTNGYLDLGADTGIRLYGDVTIPNGGKLTMWDTGDDFSVYMSVTNDSTWLHLTGQLNVSANIMVGSTLVPDSAGGATIGTDDLEWAGLSLHNGAVISGQADQSNTITSSAAGWTFNLFPITPSAAPDADYEVANKKYVDENPGTPTNITPVDAADEDATFYPILVDGATGTQATETDAGITYNPSTNTLTTTTFTGALAGNASTATILATARTIGGVSFNGSANIDPYRGTESETEVTLDIDDLTPDVSNGGSKIYRLFKTANTAGIAGNITDFDDGVTDKYSEFNDGDWIIIRVEDANTTFDFDGTPGYLVGNAGQNWTGDASHPMDVKFRLRKDSATTGAWMCETLNAGHSNPTTLAIDKAQFDWTIANPQAITIGQGADPGPEITVTSDNVTLGTEILSSTVYLTSDSDKDSDTLVLQVAGAGYDGVQLTFITKAGFDDPSDAVIIDIADAACNDGDCPYGASFELRGIGATITLRWDSTTASWWLENYYQPPVDYYVDSTYRTTISGIDSISATAFFEYSINKSVVTVLYRIAGDEAFTVQDCLGNENPVACCTDADTGATCLQTVTFTVPYPSKDRSDAGMVVKSYTNTYDGSGEGTSHGIASLEEDGTTVSCYPTAASSGMWDADTDEVRVVQGQFSYQVE